MMVSRSPGLISSQGGRDNWCHSERRCDCDGLDDYGKGTSHMKTADAKQTHKLGPAYFSLCPGVSCDQCIISVSYIQNSMAITFTTIKCDLWQSQLAYILFGSSMAEEYHVLGIIKC